jgi:hypothetical protein
VWLTLGFHSGSPSPFNTNDSYLRFSLSRSLSCKVMQVNVKCLYSRNRMLYYCSFCIVLNLIYYHLLSDLNTVPSILQTFLQFGR